MIKSITFLIAFLYSILAYSNSLNLGVLKVNNRFNPIGIVSAQPHFSWEIIASKRNTHQSSYHILVSDNESELKKNRGNIWDSGEIKSAQSIQIKFQGKPLQATKTYYWKVAIRDNHKKNSGWSEVAFFQMGLSNKDDWKGANWIAFEKLADSNINILPLDNKKDKYFGSNVLPLLRKDFRVQKPVSKASLFISGLGHFEASINGKKQGDNFLDAGWVKYDKEALYVTFDVTQDLRNGNNSIGVMLGNGFYYVPPVKGRFRKLKTSFGLPKMICRLLIQYQDGSTESIVSDKSWKTAASPITFSSIYGGEDYDARLEQNGWDSPGFNDTKWQQVLQVDGPPVLKPQNADPLKVMQIFPAQSITLAPNNHWIYDLGQNASGIVRLKVKGNRGDTIKIYPGELLDKGQVTQKATGSPYYFQYVLKGEGEEIWQPRFTYYGFRYLELRGANPTGKASNKALPEVISLEGLHTRNAAAGVGEFTSSKQLFNQTHQLIDWAVKSNMASVLTDCPHREKLGWLEQAHLMAPSIMYNYDIATLADKVVEDIIASQLDNGLIPEIAPEFVQFTWGDEMFRDSPEWGSTGIILPWYLYKWYGNTEAMEKAYPTMQRYIAYLQTKAKNNILSQGLGDWFDLGPERPGVSQLTPMGVTGTAIFYYDLQILQKIAALLGKPDDVLQYKKLAEDVKIAFNKTFFNKETKQYASGSQTANAMALYMQLVDPEYKEAVLENLIKDIRDKNNGLTAGDIGYRYVLRVLEEAGRSDVIYDMDARTDVPGYGYQLAKGATALTESWQALPNVSNNHLMLGHLMEWFYSGLAGIRQEDQSMAFNEIKIFPEPVGDVNSAKASYHSSYGLISSEWNKTKGTFDLMVNIPANTTAKIYLPANAQSIIKEGKQLIADHKNIRSTRLENNRYIIQVGSGSYHFKVQNHD